MRFQLGFRARLAATIAGVFVLGSAAVIGVQLLLLSHLFGDTMSAQHLRVTQEADDVTRFEIGAGADGAVHLEHWEGYLPIDGPMILVTPELGPSIADLESAELRQVFGQMQDQANAEVLHRLVLWSGVVLAAAAALAVIAAGWLSKRSLGRIAEVTAATQAIGASDLHQRLALAGPNDEIKALGDTIDGMLARIEDAFARQDRFIAGASHELRTPLATTRAALEIPLEQGLIAPEAEPDIRIALAANERGTRLVAALLTLAKSHRNAPGSSDGLPGVDQAQGCGIVDWTTMVEELLGERRALVKESGIEIEALTSSKIETTVDQDLLLLATGNLLDNAIAHNRPGGRVEISLGDDDGCWLEVTNDGADLTAADLQELREPFHRGNNSRLSGAGQGLGLGLALVDSVAEALGGTLALTANTNGGLTARLHLPREG